MTDLSFGPWRQVADRVYVSVAQPADTNVILVAGDEHALLIDPGATPTQGAALALSAAEVAGRDIDRVLITHGHWDHFFGLAGLNARSYGHETLVEAFGWKSNREALSNLGLAPNDLVMPSHMFSIIQGIFLGGVHVEAMRTHPGHTPGDLVVLVPESNVVIMGDLVEPSGPQIDEQSSLKTWPKAIDSGLSAANDDTVIIPGHGDIVDNIFVVNQRNHIEALLNQADYLASQGVTLDQALNRIDADLAAEIWPPVPPATITAALPLAYAQLEVDGRGPAQRRRQLPLV